MISPIIKCRSMPNVAITKIAYINVNIEKKPCLAFGSKRLSGEFDVLYSIFSDGISDFYFNFIFALDGFSITEFTCSSNVWFSSAYLAQ
jgi:hypothetical protein